MIKTQKTVMIIEKEKNILEILKLGLQKSGFNVHSFSDPLKALIHLEDGCPECGLAICNLRMPNLSGFQLTRRIRSIAPQMKIVFMTVFEINKTEFDSIFPSTEIENLIRKPFDPSKLVEVVKDAYHEKSAIA